MVQLSGVRNVIYTYAQNKFKHKFFIFNFYLYYSNVYSPQPDQDTIVLATVQTHSKK